MAAENTGYKAYAKLLKVTDDGTNRPLDINNNLCSESGLPQHQKFNLISDPNYVSPVLDLTACPLPIPPEVNINTYQSGDYACIGGQVGILSAVNRGNVYWIGNLEDNVTVYTDEFMTIPVPYGYIKVNTSPARYLVLSSGVIGLAQSEGEPC